MYYVFFIFSVVHPIPQIRMHKIHLS